MWQKIKDLCEKPHQPLQGPKQLDNLAMAIFGQNADSRFVLSTHIPEKRYSVDINEDTISDVLDLEYRDRFLPNFRDLGPNEKYVVHKIFYSNNNVICVIGGIGVGKTSFSRFLIDLLLPQVSHSEKPVPERCPQVIYFDFNAYDNIAFPKTDNATALKSFARILGKLIDSVLARGKYFSVVEEISEVWDELLKNQAENNPAINWLSGKLRTEQVESWDVDNPGRVLGKRRQIREELEASENNLSYYAALLNYIKRKYYPEHYPCLCVIIDNVDRESAEIHATVEKTIKTFANLCNVRIVFNVRQTTFHQRGDNFQQLVDQVPYCGPDPYEIVSSRIDSFVGRGPIFDQCMATYQPEAALEAFRERLEYIKKTFLDNDRFKVFFRSLCGHSVRKGLKIAQSLIYNSVYNPFEVRLDRGKSAVVKDGKALRMGDVIRALMVGKNETYTHGDVIENVFQTQTELNSSHFIKLRILKAVRQAGAAGKRIGRLVRSLKTFGYGDDLIEDSLDELLSDNKRLIWTDTSSMIIMSSKNLIEKNPESLLFLNSIGEGYINILFKNLDYIQEVMMDTSVESSRFGSGWNSRHLKDRLSLVLRFCEYLFEREQSEMKNYRIGGTNDEYVRIYGDKNLITLEIMEELHRDVDAILTFIIDHSDGEYRDDIIAFRESQLGIYQYRIDEARNTQKRVYGN